MADADIWRLAEADGTVVISKDRDFLDLAAVRGSPPILLVIALGNASTPSLLALPDVAWPMWSDELGKSDAGVVMLERARPTVRPALG